MICLPFAFHYLQGDRPVNLAKYFLRRLTRLEPPYILCISICFALLVFTKGESLTALAPHYLATITYTHNLLYKGFSTINGVAWSLEIEIQFYILAPLIVRVFFLPKISRRVTLVSMIVIACLAQPILKPGLLNIGQFIQYFLLGFLLCDIYVSDWSTQPRQSLTMDILWIFAASALYALTGDHDRVWYDPIWCAATCTVLFVGIYASFCGKYIHRILSLPVLTVIGGMCYTIYLYHEQAFSLIGRLTIPLHMTDGLWTNYSIQFILMVPAMLALTSLPFVLFEKPFMRKTPRRSPDRSPFRSEHACIGKDEA